MTKSSESQPPDSGAADYKAKLEFDTVRPAAPNAADAYSAETVVKTIPDELLKEIASLKAGKVPTFDVPPQEEEPPPKDIPLATAAWPPDAEPDPVPAPEVPPSVPPVSREQASDRLFWMIMFGIALLVALGLVLAQR